MAPARNETRNADARFAMPLVGVVDPLGYLEVAGPVPAQEMGLAPRQRVRLVGTAYDPATVGSAYAQRGVAPRYLVRVGKRRTGGTRGKGAAVGVGRPTRRSAYQSRTIVRIAADGEETRVVYRLHEPSLAGQRVAMVSNVEQRSGGAWALGATALLCLLTLAVGVLLGWHDRNAVRGNYRGKTRDEIRTDLSHNVAWDSMEISVASAMTLDEGATTVEARLENVAANHCDQKVRMYETDNPSDLLFESGAIAPGEYIQFVELAHPLTPGTHEVTVEFQGYERAPSLVSNEGKLLGHDSFGASCAAEVIIYCRPKASTAGTPQQ